MTHKGGIIVRQSLRHKPKVHKFETKGEMMCPKCGLPMEKTEQEYVILYECKLCNQYKSEIKGIVEL
jgi:Zn finger protein HypA/HybF involved in hydrogenase expression